VIESRRLTEWPRTATMRAMPDEEPIHVLSVLLRLLRTVFRGAKSSHDDTQAKSAPPEDEAVKKKALPDDGCRHCVATGTCRSGFQDRFSCVTCLRAAGLEPEYNTTKTASCSVCNGTGRFLPPPVRPGLPSGEQAPAQKPDGVSAGTKNDGTGVPDTAHANSSVVAQPPPAEEDGTRHAAQKK
jgi:hypothetical protein